MLTDVLHQYGFSEKEAKVYLACLELWTAPASTIARRVDENRVTVYSVLKVLKKRGIVYESLKKGTTYYTAIEPTLFFDQQQSKLKQLEEKMPELMALVNMHSSKPKIQFFEGVEWLKHLYLDTLCSDDDILAFLATKTISEELRVFLDNVYVPARLERWISAKVLISWGDVDSEYSKVSSHADREVRIVQDSLFSVDNEINMYGKDKIAMMLYSEHEMCGLLIQSKALFSTMKNIFELIWKHNSLVVS